jgi:hypothetical protein
VTSKENDMADEIAGTTGGAEDPELAAFKKNWSPVDVLGFAAGLVPFVLSFSTSSETSVEMHGTSMEISTRTHKHMDYVAVAGGAVAVVCAFVGLLLIARMRTRAVRFVVFAVLLALGGFQLVRGFLVESGTHVSGTILR